MKTLLSYLISEITGSEDFEIDEDVGESGYTNLTLKVSKDHMGLVIGKKGKMISALRSILRTKATLDRIGFSLNVVEKES